MKWEWGIILDQTDDEQKNNKINILRVFNHTDQPRVKDMGRYYKGQPTQDFGYSFYTLTRVVMEI